MTAPELKPCPFCGGDEFGHTGKKTLAIVCMGCGATGAHADGSHERSATWCDAYGLWNTRTDTIPSPLDDPRVKALVDAVQAYSDATDAWAKLNCASNLRSAGQCRIAMFAALSAITKEQTHER